MGRCSSFPAHPSIRPARALNPCIGMHTPNLTRSTTPGDNFFGASMSWRPCLQTYAKGLRPLEPTLWETFLQDGSRDTSLVGVSEGRTAHRLCAAIPDIGNCSGLLYVNQAHQLRSATHPSYMVFTRLWLYSHRNTAQPLPWEPK
jgi:hypothetical protein